MSRSSTIGRVVWMVGAAAAVAVAGVGGGWGGGAVQPVAPPVNGPERTVSGLHVLVGGRVHVEPGKVIENAALVVRDGLIEEVRELKSDDEAKAILSEGGGGAQLWDVGGMNVYAGFIESFYEVDAPRASADSAGAHWNGLVAPERRALDGAGIAKKDAEGMRKLGFTAAAISPKRGIFRGWAAVVSLGDAEEEASEGRPRVYRDGVYQAAGFDEAGGGGPGGGGGSGVTNRGGAWSGYPGSQMGSIALMRQTLIDADWFESRRSAGKGEDAPVAEDALARSKGKDSRGALIAFDAGDELEVLRGIKVAQEFSRRIMVIGSGTEYRRLAAIAEACGTGAGAGERVGMVVPMAYPEAPKVASVGDAESVDLRELMAWEQAGTNLRRLDEAGVRVAVTSSKAGSGRDRHSGRDKFHENMRRAVRNGLKAERALAMVTTEPAAMLGVSDLMGTIEKGKAANFVVTDGELFKKKTKVREVWVDGKRYEVSAGESPAKGEWKVELEPQPMSDADPTKAAETALSIDGENGVTLKKDDKRVTAKSVVFSRDGRGSGGGRLNFVFDHKEFGGEGVFAVSVLIEGEKFVGSVVRADGARMVIRGTRVSKEPVKEEKKKEEGEKKEGEAKDANPAAADAGDGAAKEGEGKQGEGEREGEGGAATPPAGEAVGEAQGAGEGKKEGEVKEKDKEDEDAPITDVAAELPVPFTGYGVRGEMKAKEAGPGEAGGAGGGAVVFTNATVWTSVAGSEPLENGAVVISGGKIVYVGTDRELAGFLARASLPADVERVDLGGKHITAGLIDCHSHTGISGGVNEGGQAVTTECRIQDVTNPDAINWYRQLAGGITTVNNLHGSANPMGGQNCVNKVRWGCAHPDDMHFAGRESYAEYPLPGEGKAVAVKAGVKFALGENVKQSNWGDGPTSRYPRSRMGVEALIVDRFVRARAYAKAMKEHAEAVAAVRGQRLGAEEERRRLAELDEPRRDLELEALAEVLEGSRLVHCHSYRQDEILALARVAKEFGFRLGTYQHGLECYKVADAVRESAIGASLFADWWAYKVEVQDAVAAGGPILHEEGVVVSYNSDSDEMARRMNVEAAKAVKYGGADMTATDALRFVTWNPAKQLGIEDRVGSIEVGKDADLAVWSGKPLSSLSRCEQTWVDGKQLFSLERDAAAREWVKTERARLIQKVLTEGDKKKDAKTGEGPAEGGEGGRRRGPRPGDDESQEEWAGVRERLLDMVRRGYDPDIQRPGQCGCEQTEIEAMAGAHGVHNHD